MSSLRILLVEDSEDDALLLLRELKRGGYETRHERVETPEAMREALENGEWDVVISDFRMPRFDAPGALDVARRTQADAPFIVVSGKVGEEAAVAMMKAGATDYVMKDDLARLCATVERGLEEARSRRERVRIEDELRESRERFELAVRGADDGIWDWDIAADTVYFSPRWKSILGYEDHEIENRFEEWESRVHPDDRERATETIREHLEGLTEHYELEHRLLHKDGTYRWIRARGTSVRNGRGEAVRFAGSHSDITDRRRDEENLRRRAAILEAVRFAAERFLGHADGWESGIEDALAHLGEAAEASRVYVFENFTGDDGEVWATQRYEWVAKGVSPQIDNPVLEALPYRKAGFGRWVETLGRGEPVYGHVREFPGSERPELRSEGILSIAVVPIFASGEWWGFVGFDECEREREWPAAEMDALTAAANTLGAALQRQAMEAELREEEERYRSVIEQATDAIFLLDASTKYIFEANAAFERIFGYTPEEIPSLTVYDLVAHTREDVDATIRRTLKERRRFVGERKYRKKDGSLADVEVGVSVIVHRGRELICTICRDVTERKRDEARIRSSEAELRALFEAMDDPIFVIDKGGRHIEVAPTNAPTFYLPPAEISGRTLHDIFPKVVADEFLARVRRVLATRRRMRFEYALDINGERMWFEGAISPMLDDSVVWVARDITERKESEERFRGLAEATFEGVAITREGKIVETNSAFAGMFGYSRSEVIGMDPLDVTAPESRESVNEARTAGLEEPYEAVLLRKDGTTFDSEIRARMSRYMGKPVRVTAFRDISERKKDERTLRESEERFRTAFDSAAIGMGIVSLEGRWMRVNRPLCEITGYPESELLGLTFRDITHPDDLDRDVRMVERVLAGEIRTYQLEKRYVRKEGGIVWILLSVALVRDGEGEPLYFISQIQDITRRKRAEEALAQSERRLRTIIETEPECVKVLDMNARLVEMNPAGLAMMEADSLDELRGKSIYDLVQPEHRAGYVALTERVLGGGSGTLEFEGLGLKGGRGWAETHAVPLRDARGEISGLLGITRDITERKRAEKSLKESERLYRTVISQATENIFLVDVETGYIVGSNPAFRESLGYSEEELGATTLFDIVAASRESVERNMRRTLAEGRSFVGERRYRRKDGTFLDVEVSGSVIVRDGKETLVAVAHDVTERARAQRLLEERVSALSRISASLTLDLSAGTTLDALAGSVVAASGAIACSVALMFEDGHLRIEGSHGLPEGFEEGIEAVWRDGRMRSVWRNERSPTIEAVRSRRPVLAENMKSRMLSNQLYKPVHEALREAAWDTVFIVPLVSRGRSLGAINFAYLPGEEPGEDEQTFLEAVADQAAIAVENARLLTEARGKAALEERQRLSRELHDSVSQALYGIALGAKTARKLIEREPERAADPLDYVISLTDAGLAEMRALIFELRPESLETEGLAAALGKQAAAIEARYEIEVRATLCEEPRAPLETKEAIYRIAQESLNNTVKHARASVVEMNMECAGEGLSLEISDDGVGFESGGEFPGHVGLRSMRERAARLGGTLEVDSSPETGTRVRAKIPIG